MSDKDHLNQAMQTLDEIQRRIAEFSKVITSADTAFPVRENLAAEAKLIVPVDTPLLNRLPQHPGSGKAAAWKEITSFGSDPSTVFYAETGQPSGRATVYADRSEVYKLLGLDGGVTNFAIAAGANYMDQLAIEKRNTILHLKRLEEAAIINASGAGADFTGIRAQVTTGNGAYVAANTGTAPTAVNNDLGALMKAAWDKGWTTDVLVVRSTEGELIGKAVTRDASSALRIGITNQAGISGGFYVNRYISPIDGSTSEILPDKFHTNGEILGLATQMPAPVPNQGGDGIFLDMLLDYAMSDVPTATDQTLFRIVRYYTLPIPGRKGFGKITGY